MLENPFYHDEEAKAERSYLRRVIAILGALCFVLLFALAATWPTQAYADPTFRSTHNGHPVVLKLSDKPCTNAKVLSHLQPRFHALFKEAKLNYEGADWASCWTEHDGLIHSIDEEGAPLVPVPVRAFREETI